MIFRDDPDNQSVAGTEQSSSRGYHLKVPHRFFNSSLFLLRAYRLPGIRRFRLIIILPLYDPMFPLYLGDIQIRHMKSVFSLHPLLDLLIGRFALSSTHIHLFHIELHGDMILRSGKFGQKAYRLDVQRQ